MKSMTGFGHADTERDGMAVTVDVRSYNNRFLDLSVSLPSYLTVLEPRVRETLSGRVERGKVEVIVRVTEHAAQGSIVVDEALARSYIHAMKTLSGLLERAEAPSLSHLVKMEGVFRVRREQDEEKTWSLLAPVIEEALDGFERSRVREGGATERDILAQIGVVETELAAAERLAPELERRVRENLRARLTELVGDRYDETRLLTETAQTMARFDVNEELKRMRAHLQGFRETAAGNGGCGRMLDFICQELHREINTLGSKSVMLEIDQAVLRMKEALEKIREQVRNVE